MLSIFSVKLNYIVIFEKSCNSSTLFDGAIHDLWPDQEISMSQIGRAKVYMKII